MGVMSMAIPMSDIGSRFIRYREGATLSRDDRLRFMDYDQYPRAYGRVTTGQLGYNAQNPSIAVRKIRLSVDNVNLPTR